MIFYLLMILALCFLGSKIYPVGELSPNYITKKNTTPVKGAFLMLVFSRHFTTYVELNNPFDLPFDRFDSAMGQLIVAMFLFYSGYGVFISYLNKGEQYVREMPVKRILVTLVNFWVAVILFIAVCLNLNVGYAPFQYIFAFTAYTSVGNSNWYIWAVLWLYVISFISFSLFLKKPGRALCAIWLLTGVYVAIMMFLKSDSGWWYNTAICYPFGMLYACIKDHVDEVFRTRHDLYVQSLVVSALGVFVFSGLRTIFFFYELLCLSFVCFILLLTMKIEINNGILYWMGDNLFEVYILQRIPMVILHVFNITRFVYFSFAASIAATVLMASIFRVFNRRLDRWVINICTRKTRNGRVRQQ